jgi:hypothetical protein
VAGIGTASPGQLIACMQRRFDHGADGWLAAADSIPRSIVVHALPLLSVAKFVVLVNAAKVRTRGSNPWVNEDTFGRDRHAAGIADLSGSKSLCSIHTFDPGFGAQRPL